MTGKFTLLPLLAFAALLPAAANEQPTGNANPAYSPSQIQAQLRLHIRPDAETVHFIRDTGDPKIVTRIYVLKHADPYSIRPYLREMVQAVRVNYTAASAAAAPDYYNVYAKAPTGVECVKFVDGTGMLLVSAEAYRFRDTPAAPGIDTLVARLDRPGMLNSSGQPKYLYFAANRPASELRTLLRNVGANISNDTVELIGGKDKIECDTALNCLFFNTALYSRKHIEAMLKLYDVVHPEVRIRYTVYELNRENDGRIGLDFQAWKNNDGVNFFSTGAVYRDNWANTFAGGMVRGAGSADTNYFNFNPKWNSRYLDFLVSRGHARIASSGELAVQNGATGLLDRRTGIFLAENDSEKNPQNAGPAVSVSGADGFRFLMTAKPSITRLATTLEIGIHTRSLIGYRSDGRPRTAEFGTLGADGLPTVLTRVMIGNGRTRFYLGGIEKTEIVRGVGGIPLLKDLPFLGWLFSTENESTRQSRLVVVAECEVIRPDRDLPVDAAAGIRAIESTLSAAEAGNRYGFGQLGLDPERTAAPDGR